MNKKHTLFSNTFSSFAVQVAAILSSFIVPKCILSAFGSVTNGTVNSIAGFLSFITLMEAGVGNVSRSALFGPVSRGDTREISLIVNETHDYFRKIALVYLLFTAVFAGVFPLTIDNGESYWFNLLLVFVIALANFFQYYFGAGYLQVLWADQKVYLLNLTQAVAYALNIVFAILCVWLGAGIHLLKLLSSLVFLIRPLFVNLYVKKHYHIDTKAKSSEPVLRQKWSNTLQTIAYFVHSKTDVIVLTYFAGLASVSVYSVYATITTGLSAIIHSLCNGFTARVGHLHGANRREQLMETFDLYEHFVFNITVPVFTTAGIVILDFVRLYTAGLTDAQYHQPVFALMILLAEMTYCLRLPYSNMISVAGHFRETQNAALIEAAMNIVISLFAVRRFGLIGISIGTFLAMLYRTAYQVWYLSRNILMRNWMLVVRKLLHFLPVPLLGAAATRVLHTVHPAGYTGWLLEALLVFAVALAATCMVDLLFYRALTARCLDSFRGR